MRRLDPRAKFRERPAACPLAVDPEHLVPARLVVARPVRLAVDPERPVLVHPVALARPRPAEHSAAAAVVGQAFAAVEQTHSTR